MNLFLVVVPEPNEFFIFLWAAVLSLRVVGVAVSVDHCSRTSVCKNIFFEEERLRLRQEVY